MSILISIKRSKLNSHISLFWLISGFGLLIILCIPNLVEFISIKLGFEKTSNMIFFFTIFVAFWLLYIITIKVSENYERSVKLTQEIGLLQNRIHKLEEKYCDTNKS